MSYNEILKIESNDIFKILTLGFSGILVPVALIEAILSLFNVVKVDFNNIGYDGLQGFIIAIVTLPIYILLLSGVMWIFLIIGLRLTRLIARISGKIN